MALDRLYRWLEMDNVAKGMDEFKLNTLGQRVLEEYEIDCNSRASWEETNKEAMNLARQVKEASSEPWENSANVKYPLITVACIQFAARVYPEIIRGEDVVKGKVVGLDPQNVKADRAIRIGKHMSWQLLEKQQDWESDTDKLCHVMPIMGCAFRKTYRDVVNKQNVSELCLPEDVVVNNRAKSLEKARRITQVFWQHNNDIWENVRRGIWLEHDFGYAHDPDNPSDADALHEFLEQHRYYDLDEDGYQEPYIVTVHKETGKVVRIVARWNYQGIIVNDTGRLVKIEPDHYFTMYPFIPDPTGDFYPLGFGALMEPLNSSINTIINQLLDAGTLANLQGGFVGRGVRIPGGEYRFRPGEWKQVDATGQSLRDNIFPMPIKEPSPVLFQLLGFLVEASKDISSIKDVLTGDAAAIGPNTPVHTVMAMVEQGLKVFGAITKRMYKAMKSEYKKLFDLNRQYLSEEEYFMMLDDPKAVWPEDYDDADIDVVPVADPTMASDMQRMMKTRGFLEMSGRPGINEVELTRMAVEAIDRQMSAKLLLSDQELAAQKPPPDPRLMEVQARAAAEQMRLGLEADKHQLEMEKLLAEIEELRAKSLEHIAKAEGVEPGRQLEMYREQLKLFQADIKARTDLMKERIKAGARTQTSGPEAPGGMAPAPGNAGGVPGSAEGEGPLG